MEKRGSMINIAGRLQELNPACIPPADARTDWEVIRDLTLSISGEALSESTQNIENLFQVIASSIPEFEGKKLTSIGKLGEPLINTGITIPLLEKENQRKANGEIVG